MNPEFKYASAISMLQKLCRDEEGNFVFSPLSLGTCFAMAAVGLKGESKDQLLTFLKASDEEALHRAFANLLADDSKPLEIANKLIAAKQYSVLAEAESTLKTKYRSEIEFVDFEKDARQIESRVNSWVSGKTKGKIPQLLAENTLTSQTVMVLLNAIYFKGTWLNEFDNLSDKQYFQLRNGEKVERDFIKQRSAAFTYKETETLRFVKIPYRERPFCLLVAIPKDSGKNIDEIIAEAPPSELASTIRDVRGPEGFQVILTMPKFKIEYNLADLPKRLADLGVSKMFIAGECDFGNLFSEMEQPPYISEIIHKAVIEVNERGTEAAAATAMIGLAGCAPPMRPPQEIEVTLDRPFCFWIISENHMVTFAGICANPC